MSEQEFNQRVQGRAFTLGQIALLRKVHSLPYNRRDLPKHEADRSRAYEEAIGRFNRAGRKRHEREV